MNIPEFEDYDYIGINGVSEYQLLHPHFIEWQKWFVNSYKGLKDRVAVFIPCAAIKPYYNSPIHKGINSVLNDFYDIHRIVISNVGVVPYEFCNEYPFNSYDWNPLFEDDKIQKKYYEVNKKRLYDYLNVHSYRDYVVYMRNESISYRIVCDVCKDLNISIHEINVDNNIDCSNKDPDLVLIDKVNLQRLELKLKEILGD